MPTQKEIRQQITNQIIDTLKNGNLPPWRRPWGIAENSGFPINVESKRQQFPDGLVGTLNEADRQHDL